MGKVRKRKLNKVSNNVAASNNDEEELPVDCKENVIQTMIDQIQTANVEEKYCGLQTFAMLIESPDSLKQMIDQGIVKIVAPLLLDSAGSVRNAAAGSLRNLSTTSLEACDMLMENDIMTPLVCYFHQYSETWTPDVDSKTKDEEIDTFVQCTNLLLNLCESSDLAVKYVGESKILDIVPNYLDVTIFGADLVIAIMQLLFVLVEDNPLAIKKVCSTTERQLRDLLSLESSDPSALLIKTLTGGIIINICGGDIASLPIDVLNQIFAVLAQTLSADHKLVCNELSSSVPLCEADGKVVSPKGKEAQQLDNKIKSVSRTLDSQQTAIEIIANICSCEEAESSDSEETGNDDRANEDMCSNGEEVFRPEDRLSPVVMEALNSLKIFDKVWARTQLPPVNVVMILQEYEGTKSIIRKLRNLQTRAFLCMNNIILSLPLELMGGIHGIYKIWVEAGKLVFKQSSENLELLESATAVMRTTLNRITSLNNITPSESSLFSDLAMSDIELMLMGIKNCEAPEIRSNLIRMIGVLALLFVNDLNDTISNVICSITEFILEQAHKENEVWVLAEAIDTLIDLYSEDKTDILAAKIKLVEKLQILVPVLRNKARQQKKLPKDYKVLVTTVNSNLPRFIKYKKQRVAKL
ncbi:HEAT repeat-containing protein 3 [Melitaea cinxia]|uniref:HEAT repeat-containing protein 3 n=1 Tax=Melitaea cinxia TaxID=113334 RepID=UPI001E270B00|nr:HEAT repeat-containing protein 3 [Melitaea cinxia]